MNVGRTTINELYRDHVASSNIVSAPPIDTNESGCSTTQSISLTEPLNRISEAGLGTLQPGSITEQQGQTIWTHGILGSGRKSAVKEFIDQNQEIYQDRIFWIDAGTENSDDLIKNWKDFIIKEVNPAMKHAPPESFHRSLANIESSWQNKPYLIVFTNVKYQNYQFLEEISQGREGNQTYFIVSEEQLGIDSIERKSSPTQKIPDISQNHELLENCIKLSSFSRFGIDEVFLRQFIGDESIKQLENNKLIFLHDGHYYLKSNFFLLKETQIEKKHAEQSKFDLIKNLREYVQRPFTSQSQKWVIRHITDIFNDCFKDKKINCELGKDIDFCYILSSLMLDIGHYYSQNDRPDLAEELSLEARSYLEAAVDWNLTNKSDKGVVEHSSTPKKKDNVQKGKHVQPARSLYTYDRAGDCIKELKQLNPGLPFLYTELNYQIGRLYFYHKSEEQIIGSQTIFDYAKELSDQLEKEMGEKIFLSVMIERNGILFHKQEKKQFEDVVANYRSLCNENEPHLNFDYRTSQVFRIVPSEDPLNRSFCMQYLIKAKMEQIEELKVLQPEDSLIQQKLEELRTDLEELQKGGALGSRARLILAAAYLALDDIDQADRQIKEMLADDNLSKEIVMEVRKIELRCLLKKGDFVEASTSARKYRDLAESYYPKGLRAIYDLFIYEDPVRAENIMEHGLTFLMEMDEILRRSPSFAEINKKIEYFMYSSENEKRIILRPAYINSKENEGTAKLVYEKLEVYFRERKIYLPLKFNTKKQTDKHFALDLSEDFHCQGLLNRMNAAMPKDDAIRDLIVEEDPRDPSIIWYRAGPERTLKLTKTFKKFLEERGDLEGLEEELKRNDFNKKKSDYFSGSGYRLKLQEQSVDESAELPDPLPEPEVWSDDEIETDVIDRKIEKFIEKAKAIDQKRGLSINSSDKLRSHINTQISSLSKRFAEKGKTDRHERKEFAEQYLQKKLSALETLKDKDERRRAKAKVVDAEIQYLDARMAYLQEKKMSLSLKTKRTFSKEIENENQVHQELEESLTSLEEIEVVKSAKPATLAGSPPDSISGCVEHIHFRQPRSFIYHTLKHHQFSCSPFQPQPQSDQSSTQLVLSREIFEQGAIEYLTQTKTSLEKNIHNCDGKPDQYKASIIDYRYYPREILEKEKSEKDKAEKLNLLVQNRKKALKAYEANTLKRRERLLKEYNRNNNSSSLNYQHNANAAEQRLQLVSGSVNKRQKSKSQSKIPFLVIATERNLDGTYNAYFKTQFEQQMNLPSGEDNPGL